ncbi:hypothetical protein Tco_0565860 [Tanacetum coccineum]
MDEFVTEHRANYYSGITSITVNGKDAYELKGIFLDDLLKNALSGTNGEDAVEHIEYFLIIVNPVDLPNINYERLRLAVFPILLVGNASKWFDEFKSSITTSVDLNENFFGKYYPPSRTCNVANTKATKDPTNTITKTYKESENELDNEVDEPRSKNGVPYEIYGFCNGGELPRMIRVGYMTYFQHNEWYDDLTDNNLKEEALKQKAIYENSWGDATQKCWWKINDHECSPFANWRDYICGPYTNVNTTYDPYLDSRNGKTSNNYDIQEEQELRKKEERCELFDNPRQEPPVCKFTRTYAYQDIICSMDEGWLVTRAE